MLLPLLGLLLLCFLGLLLRDLLLPLTGAIGAGGSGAVSAGAGGATGRGSTDATGSGGAGIPMIGAGGNGAMSVRSGGAMGRGSTGWMVELGRVDICCEVSQMSSHLTLPRESHLNQLYHIFLYLKSHHNTEMVYDPSEPEIRMDLFEKEDLTNTVYGGESQEALPPNMPQPRGMGFTMRVFVDSDHAGDSITRRSRTGFLVYLNSSLIYWMSKKQGSIEISSFGSEFVAMKTATEYVRGLRYKLRMFGQHIFMVTISLC